MSLATAIANEFNDARQLISGLAKELGLDVGANYSAYGFTKDLEAKDRLLETSTPYTLIDKESEPVVFSDGMHERLGIELWDNTATVEANWVDNGSGYYTASGATVNDEVYDSGIIVPNKSYLVEYTISNYVSGTIYTRTGGTFDSGSQNSSNGVFKDVLNAPSDASSSLIFDIITEFSGTISNISVREVQTITLPEAPFDPSATDELLDDKVNGLVCQQPHNEGDIVVKRGFINENPNFKNGLVGYNDENTYWSVSNEKAIHAVSSDFNPLSVDISDVPDGAYFTIFFNIDITFGSGVMLSERQVGIASYQQFIVDGLESQTVKKTAGSNAISFSRNTVSVGFSLDDVYVYIGDSKDSIKQATRDTSEMKDITTDDTTVYDFETGLVYQIDSPVSSGQQGHFYLCVNGGYSDRLASAAFFENTTYFTHLGTASNMDLRNPYFQTLNQVTRQDVITLRKNKTTNVVDYYTFKGTKYFGETHSQKEVMEAYGFTQIDNNLWEDVDYEYVFVKLTGSLNAGAYHPIYNSFGTRSLRRDTAQSSARTWWASNAEKVYSTYSTFDSYYLCTSTANGTGDILDSEAGLDAYGNTAWSSSRPDRLFYNKSYLLGKGGLLGNKLPYAGKVSEEDLLREESNKLTRESDLEEGVEIVKRLSSTPLSTGISGTTGTTFVAISNTYSSEVDGSSFLNTDYAGAIRLQNVWIIDAIGTLHVMLGFYNTGEGNFTWGAYSTTTDVIDISSDCHFYITEKQPYLLTYGKDTTTDIIGSPSAYPSDWLSHLSSGKGIVGNALLVNQDGTSAMPQNGSLNDMASKKVLENYQAIKTEDNGVVFSTSGAIFDLIDNAYTFTSAADYTNWVFIKPYKSANQALVQDEPKKVISVLPKALASNKHNNLMPYTATRKVPVGNGSNGDESRTLENDYGLESYHVNSNSTGSWSGIDGDWTNTRILHNSASSASYTSQKTFGVYEFRGSFTGTIADLSVADLTLTEGNGWYLIANDTVPEYNTIRLDNSDGAVWFNTLAVADDGEYMLQVHTKELVWDFTKDTDTDFASIIGTTTGFTAGTYYKATGSNYNGVWYCVKTSVSTVFNDFVMTEAGTLTATNQSQTTYFERWNGNGFGDNNKFDDLTKVYSKRLGKWKD